MFLTSPGYKIVTKLPSPLLAAAIGTVMMASDDAVDMLQLAVCRSLAIPGSGRPGAGDARAGSFNFANTSGESSTDAE